MKILLASNSPRRKELLKELGFGFEVVSVDCDEIYPAGLAVDKIAAYLSELKSDAFRSLKEGELLITADTIVALDEEILGKPKDEVHAKEMLQKLSGKTHQVYTGITLKTLTKTVTRTDVAHVEFDNINNEELDFYIEKYKPFDKAGSYGIQEWLGMTKIKNIQGSFYTIMGLPTHLIYSLLKDFEQASS
ncbi:Maf family nucleotide pyrophosphatase [Chryseobacterium gotjawalense]|uniref:dTTP/UTP pyrophosphatase n=1 Tax=Chryseobacterium gotjawalense TaxID=3042315 RepID=A0ABY8RA03_9FLAO|nr:Maf family nucleotide pyrophosphatase [Chryseobacterium sp. wdc7]WHF50786.1 Maf family nucleotide pyrophosphatase [Chryseobacterium sp. wdc7]